MLLLHDADAGVLAGRCDHGLGAQEGRREHELVAEHEAVQVDVVPVELPAPGLGRRGRAEDAEEVDPLAVLVRRAGDLADREVEAHAVARALVAGFAHAGVHERQRRVALRLAQVFQHEAVAEHERADVEPLLPLDGVDVEADRLALLRAERREEGSARVDDWLGRDAGARDREQPGHDLAVGRDAPVRLGERGLGRCHPALGVAHVVGHAPSGEDRPLRQPETVILRLLCRHRRASAPCSSQRVEYSARATTLVTRALRRTFLDFRKIAVPAFSTTKRTWLNTREEA